MTDDPRQRVIEVVEWVAETEKLFGESFDQFRFFDELDRRHLAILLCRAVAELSEIRNELRLLRESLAGQDIRVGG